MAITKTVVDVNNGQYGAAAGGNNPWTKSDVLDALETVFQTLGMNGGTQTNGVPVMVEAPGTFSHSYTETPPGTNNSDFDKCGGVGPSFISSKNRYFKVSNNGTSAYRMLEEFRFNYGAVNTTTNEITIARHGLSTNDEVTYAAGVTSPDTNYVIGGLSANQNYFVIKVDDDKIKLSQTSGGSEVNLTSQPNNSGYYLQHKDDIAYDNFTINVLMGDTLNFDSSGASGAGGSFYLIRNHISYDASKHLDTFGTWQAAPSGNGTVSTVWNTYAYAQTESEAIFPDRGAAETGTDLDDTTDSYGIYKYMYANSTNPDMKGEIVILPSIIGQSTNYRPYWKYTVPQSGGRSELKLRVYRNLTGSSTGATLSGITIHSIGSGWSDGDSFTILGTAIGGASPANDLTFGTNTPHNNGTNGIPSIKVTNLGAGANFYQKSTNGKFAIAKVIHDAGKTFGTTYYGFGMGESNNYEMVITSGSGWRFINHKGIHSTTTSENSIEFGRYNGLQGLDYQENYDFVSRLVNSSSNYRVLTYASSNTPTSYKLQINIYRDNADPDFAVIQFVQTIDNNFVPFATFSISRGTQHGSGIYDLDYVFQDSLLHFDTVTRGIRMNYGNTQYDSYTFGKSEPAGQGSKARAASYGYLRNTNSDPNLSNFTTDFVNNINTETIHSYDNVITYYRDATFDQHKNKSVSSSANYYKPMKGIPVANGIMPVPYYLPDDFAMLQVATTPDQVYFRTGDTVTISGSEIYEIILASYEQQQTGLDGNSSGTTIGMLFLARTT